MNLKGFSSLTTCSLKIDSVPVTISQFGVGCSPETVVHYTYLYRGCKRKNFIRCPLFLSTISLSGLPSLFQLTGDATLRRTYLPLNTPVYTRTTIHTFVILILQTLT